MEAVIAPEEKRISLEGEKRGVCDTAMYLAEEQASRRASSFFFFPRVAHSGVKTVLSVLKCHIFGAR